MSVSNKAPLGLLAKELAASRAAYALGQPDADFGVGFAEGVEIIDSVFWASAWCAVALPNGDVFFGYKHVSLPTKLVRKVDNNTLLEADLESFLQQRYPRLYDQLVEQAMKLVKKGAN